MIPEIRAETANTPAVADPFDTEAAERIAAATALLKQAPPELKSFFSAFFQGASPEDVCHFSPEALVALTDCDSCADDHAQSRRTACHPDGVPRRAAQRKRARRRQRRHAVPAQFADRRDECARTSHPCALPSHHDGNARCERRARREGRRRPRERDRAGARPDRRAGIARGNRRRRAPCLSPGASGRARLAQDARAFA